MSKPPRRAHVLPGTPHHVITRANNRRRLFSYRSDYEQFLWYLKAALSRFECAVHGLTMMTNHVHVIVTPPSQVSLSALLHSVAQRYAVYRNRRRDGSGKLWQERFWCRAILSEAQLARATMYSDLNAVRAGMVADGLEYEWSTYAIHAGRPDDAAIRSNLWTPSGWYERLGASPAERAQGYLAAIRDYQPQNEPPDGIDEIEKIEALSTIPYGRRLERPDGTRAHEPVPRYPRTGKSS